MKTQLSAKTQLSVKTRHFGQIHLAAAFTLWALAGVPATPAEASGSGHGSRGHGSYGHRGAHGSAYGHGGYRGGTRSIGYRGHGRYRGHGQVYRHNSPYYGGYRGFSTHRHSGLYSGYRPYYAPVYRGPVRRSLVHRAPVYRAPAYRTPAYYPYYFQPVTYPAPYIAANDPLYSYVSRQPVVAEPAPGQPILAPAPAAPAQPIVIVLPAPGAAGTAVAPTQPAQPPAPAGSQAPAEPGKVHLRVAPSDAVAYLDEDLLGSGEAVAELGGPLVLSAGVHVIEVLHPSYPSQRLVFGVPSGDGLRVEIDLEGDHRGRKARVQPVNHGPVIGTD